MSLKPLSCANQHALFPSADKEPDTVSVSLSQTRKSHILALLD